MVFPAFLAVYLYGGDLCVANVGLSPPSVPPLTVENILKAIQSVQDIWDDDGVGVWLVGRKRDELEVHHRSDEDGGWRALVVYWLHNDPQSSWRKFIWALDGSREIETADRIRSFAEPLRGIV